MDQCQFFFSSLVTWENWFEVEKHQSEPQETRKGRFHSSKVSLCKFLDIFFPENSCKLEFSSDSIFGQTEVGIEPKAE